MYKSIKLLSLIAILGLMGIHSLSAQLIVKTGTDWKVFRDINGPPSGFGTGPNGNGDMAWASQLNYAPESSWPFAQNVTPCLTGWWGTATPASASCGSSTAIWASRPSGVCSIEGDILYFRKKFSPGPIRPDVCRYYLTVKADNNTYIYLNGQVVGGTTNNWATGTTIDVTNLLIPNQTNFIAVQATDDGITGWFSAIICGICP